MDRLTTTIKRPFLADIIAGTKRTEYRQVRSYWTKRLSKLTTPFELRLINGMSKKAPEVTVLIDRVVKSVTRREYDLHIHKVIRFTHWDAQHSRPR